VCRILAHEQQPPGEEHRTAAGRDAVANRDGVRLEIVKEFQDEGISGGGMKKRDDFLEMLAYCQQEYKKGTAIQAIVCYDSSRFSRASSVETNYFIHLFQQAGVHRLFTFEKEIDFRKEEDRLSFNVTQDFTNHKFLKNLSQSVSRGKKSVSACGHFVVGALPYGFDRVLVDKQNQEQGRFPRGIPVRVKGEG
jgi:DNA invertase Pin-like site-specific DNA recombinase